MNRITQFKLGFVLMASLVYLDLQIVSIFHTSIKLGRRERKTTITIYPDLTSSKDQQVLVRFNQDIF